MRTARNFTQPPDDGNPHVLTVAFGPFDKGSIVEYIKLVGNGSSSFPVRVRLATSTNRVDGFDASVDGCTLHTEAASIVYSVTGSIDLPAWVRIGEERWFMVELWLSAGAPSAGSVWIALRPPWKQVQIVDRRRGKDFSELDGRAVR